MLFLINAGTWLLPLNTKANGEVSFQVFYDDLSPYGTWVDSPEWGYVWVPEAGPGFQPYSTNGYWVYSGMGWTWVSGYNWGWAPFHYGRWYFDSNWGWAWVPGTEWGPCWVSWRRCDGYYGWAPLAPGFNVSMSFNWNFPIPPAHWVFVHERYFGRRDMDHFRIDRRDNEPLFRRSSIIGNTGMDRKTNVRYFSGPGIKDVQKATGRDIKPVEIRENNRPGQAMANGKMQIYRPRIEASAMKDNRRPAPQKYVAYKDRSSKPAPISGDKRSMPEKQFQNQKTPRQEQRSFPKESDLPAKQRQGPRMDQRMSGANHQAAPAIRMNPGTDRPMTQRKSFENHPQTRSGANSPQVRGGEKSPQSKGGENHPRK